MAVPTLTLIPATATLTPTTGAPTATVPPRIDPNAIAPTDTVIPPAADSGDPVADELLLLATRRVMGAANVQADDVEVVSVEPYRWLDSSLGCPLPDNTYTPVEVDGYRIVLAADDNEYIFHTSFTEVVRCAPENEVLPGVAIETEEPPSDN